MSTGKRTMAFALAIVGATITATGCSKTEPPKAETKAAASAAAATSASATASAAPIPTTPLAGRLGTEAFTSKKATLVTAKGFGEWRMTIEGSTPGTDPVTIRLPLRGALDVGKTVESSATGLTAFTKVPGVNIQSGTKNTTSTSASYRIEITKWDVKPCPTDGDPTHEGGLASGRIRVKVPDENLEISGTFTDATVKYGATPDWAYR